MKDWIARHPRWTAAGGFVLFAAIVGRMDPHTPPAALFPKSDPTLPQRVSGDLFARFVAPALKDPQSAQYREVTLRTRRGLPTLCGQVNARNSFGGYTGYRQFMVVGDFITIEGQSPPRTWARAWHRACEMTDKDDAPAGRAGTRAPPADHRGSDPS